MSSKARAAVVLGMALVVVSVGWRKLIQSSWPAHKEAPVMLAWGSDPPPPTPWLAQK